MAKQRPATPGSTGINAPRITPQARPLDTFIQPIVKQNTAGLRAQQIAETLGAAAPLVEGIQTRIDKGQVEAGKELGARGGELPEDPTAALQAGFNSQKAPQQTQAHLAAANAEIEDNIDTIITSSSPANAVSEILNKHMRNALDSAEGDPDLQQRLLVHMNNGSSKMLASKMGRVFNELEHRASIAQVENAEKLVEDFSPGLLAADVDGDFREVEGLVASTLTIEADARAEGHLKGHRGANAEIFQGLLNYAENNAALLEGDYDTPADFVRKVAEQIKTGSGNLAGVFKEEIDAFEIEMLERGLRMEEIEERHRFNDARKSTRDLRDAFNAAREVAESEDTPLEDREKAYEDMQNIASEMAGHNERLGDDYLARAARSKAGKDAATESDTATVDAWNKRTGITEQIDQDQADEYQEGLNDDRDAGLLSARDHKALSGRLERRLAEDLNKDAKKIQGITNDLERDLTLALSKSINFTDADGKLNSFGQGVVNEAVTSLEAFSDALYATGATAQEVVDATARKSAELQGLEPPDPQTPNKTVEIERRRSEAQSLKFGATVRGTSLSLTAPTRGNENLAVPNLSQDGVPQPAINTVRTITTIPGGTKATLTSKKPGVKGGPVPEIFGISYAGLGDRLGVSQASRVIANNYMVSVLTKDPELTEASAYRQKHSDDLNKQIQYIHSLTDPEEIDAHADLLNRLTVEQGEFDNYSSQDDVDQMEIVKADILARGVGGFNTLFGLTKKVGQDFTVVGPKGEKTRVLLTKEDVEKGSKEMVDLLDKTILATKYAFPGDHGLYGSLDDIKRLAPGSWDHLEMLPFRTGSEYLQLANEWNLSDQTAGVLFEIFESQKVPVNQRDKMVEQMDGSFTERFDFVNAILNPGEDQGDDN